MTQAHKTPGAVLIIKEDATYPEESKLYHWRVIDVPHPGHIRCVCIEHPEYFAPYILLHDDSVICVASASKADAYVRMLNRGK